MQLQHRDPGLGRPAKADENGRVLVEVCWPTGNVRRLYRDLIAEAPGYARSYVRLSGVPESFTEGGDGDKGNVHQFSLQRSRLVSAQVQGRDGGPVEGLACFTTDNAYAGTQKNTYMNYAWRLLRTDEEGKLAFTADLPSNQTPLVLAPTRSQLLRILPELPEELRSLPFPLPLSRQGSRTGAAAEELGALGFGIWAAQALLVRAADGRAASGAQLTVWSRRRQQLPLARVRLDRRGRALLPLPAGAHELAILDAKRGYLAHDMIAAEGGRIAPKLELTLGRISALPFTVSDANAKPVEGAYLRIVGAEGGRKSASIILQELNRLHVNEQRTGASGEGRLLYPEGLWESVKLQAIWEGPSGRPHASGVVVQVDGETRRLSFELPVAAHRN